MHEFQGRRPQLSPALMNQKLQGRLWVWEGCHYLGVPFQKTGLPSREARSPPWLLGVPSHCAGGDDSWAGPETLLGTCFPRGAPAGNALPKTADPCGPLGSQPRGTDSEERSRTGALPRGPGGMAAVVPRAEKPPGQIWWRRW